MRPIPGRRTPGPLAGEPQQGAGVALSGLGLHGTTSKCPLWWHSGATEGGTQKGLPVQMPEKPALPTKYSSETFKTPVTSRLRAQISSFRYSGRLIIITHSPSQHACVLYPKAPQPMDYILRSSSSAGCRPMQTTCQSPSLLWKDTNCHVHFLSTYYVPADIRRAVNTILAISLWYRSYFVPTL